jgi:chitodextrinase
MSGRQTSWRTASAVVMVLALAFPLGASIASAAIGDRIRPTAPTNLRVTGKTAFSVSLAWSPSTDNSGSFTYRIHHSWGYEETVPQTQTNFTWTSHLESRQTYSFYVYAVDASGNKSPKSNTVTVTLPRDTTPPSAPVVSVTDVGATHVSLAWSSIDDGPFVFFWVFKNGSPVIQGSSATSGTINLLDPETTYTFTVQARDNGINWSPLSEPLVVTTEPTNPNDTTPPSPPTNLREDHFGDGEIEVRWTASTDDVDPQSLIRYDVFLNGELADVAVGRVRSIVYGVDGLNTISVIAVDTAGNESAPTTITFEMDL